MARRQVLPLLPTLKFDSQSVLLQESFFVNFVVVTGASSMPLEEQSIRGRGASDNPANRFEKLHYVRDEEDGEDGSAPTTQFFRDRTRSIIAFNDSPDVGFAASVNPYRGCEHGCI